MPERIQPTEHELRDAFQRCGLWRRGWTFERATHTPAVLIGLRLTVLAAHRKAEREGRPIPTQPELL